MNPAEVVLSGILDPDGTLRLDAKPNLSPGRVTVVLRPDPPVEFPKDEPFWQRMQAIWDAQKAAGCVPRSAEEVEASRRETRAGWAARQEVIERLQEESRRGRADGGVETAPRVTP